MPERASVFPEAVGTSENARRVAAARVVVGVDSRQLEGADDARAVAERQPNNVVGDSLTKRG
jgi:hypothetical protein